MALSGRQIFRVVLIKASHYDDDGYVIQWRRSLIPSSSLAAVYGLSLECARERVLGPDVDLAIEAYDETNTVVPVAAIVGRIRAEGAGLVCLVGTQSNEFPRAFDLARRFRAAGLAVAIGGFHVGGCLAMLPEMPADLQAALDLGITLVAGEVEGRLATIYRDAHRGDLQPIYRLLDPLPALGGNASPVLPAALLQRFMYPMACFDAGRGCPFQCSFCTIINVQGRKSRHREADDVERILRAHVEQGIDDFFITDDNFARNRNWEAILDRMIALREGDAAFRRLRFTLQVDTLCHKIPRFVEKAARAGCTRAFVGLENINPENLAAANKRQNRIGEYRELFRALRRAGIVSMAGYIIGLPSDTPQSVARDIAAVQRELPVDFLEFFVLTPLPGSADHRALLDRGVAMDADMNRYDLEHAVTAHPRMSRAEWQQTYRSAWDWYYSEDHVRTLLRRAVADGLDADFVGHLVALVHGAQRYEGLHFLQAGLGRIKRRRERRPGAPVEPAALFYPRRLWQRLRAAWGMAAYDRRVARLLAAIRRDHARAPYRDAAIGWLEEERDDGPDEATANPPRLRATA